MLVNMDITRTRIKVNQLRDEKIYSWKVLSDILKDLGYNYNIYSIKKYETDGVFKMGKRPRTLERVIAGKSIREGLANLRRVHGV